MAQYKVIENSTGKIVNVIELTDTGSFDIGTGYSIELITGSSYVFSGSVAQDQFTSMMPYMGAFIGLFSGQLDGEIVGTLTGSVSGSTTGSLTGSLTGSFNDYSGSLGWLDDFRSGFFKSGSNISFTGSISGSVTGSLTGSFTGSHSGSGTGSYTGSFTGSYTGSFTGSFNGTASFATTASYVLGGGASVTSPGDNRLITSDGTAGGLVGESNLNFTGTILSLTGSFETTGSISMNTGSLNNPLLKGYYETMVSKSVANDYGGGIVNIDLSEGNVHKIVLDAAVNDLNISKNPTALQAGSFILAVVGDGNPRVFSWGGETTFLSGTPSVPSGSGVMSLFSFISLNSGTEYLVLVVAQNQTGLV